MIARLSGYTRFVDYFVEVLRSKYAAFEGRARRVEYWSFTLLNAFILFLIAALDEALGIGGDGGGPGILAFLYLAATIVPSVAVLVRRLHDTGRTRWWLLLGLVPILGWIALLAIAAQDSQRSANRHGPPPKGSRVG